MQLRTAQQFSQRQSLVVTAQLQRAICLLQMSNTDLQSFIEHEAEENPFLDMQVLKKERLAAERPLPGGVAAKGGNSDFNLLEMRVADRKPSLYAHVSDQLNLLFPDPSARMAAEAFLEALEPSGWLGDDLETLAGRAGLSLAEAEGFLDHLQQVEPAGIFARDLSECLKLQAREKGLLTPEFETLLDNLDKLAAADLKGLSRLCGCDMDTLREMIKRLRGLDPKPGSAFDGAEDGQRSPDLIVQRGDTGWVVDLNRSTLPSVIIDETGAKDLSRGEEATEFVADRLSQARWLRRAVEHRNHTTLKVGAEIVRRQAEFLEHGPKCIKPMILKDVANEVGVHESTVSRVTNGAMIATPQGTFPLKSFFSAALDRNDGDAEGEQDSAAAVRHRIQQLVKEEDPKKPLSDDAIAAKITAEGTELARRTVAKYRDMLKIPSSFQRKRNAKLNGVS